MINSNIYSLRFRRKREERTYYKKRLTLLKSSKSRFVVRKSLNNLQASVVSYGAKGDRVMFTVDCSTLRKLGWKGGSGNLPSAYLTGLVAGKKALEMGIKEAILDLGFNKSVKGSRLYAAVAGAVNAGLIIPHDPEMLPPEQRISGAHISGYAEILKKDTKKYESQFSAYLKKGFKPEEITINFNDIKGKIHG